MDTKWIYHILSVVFWTAAIVAQADDEDVFCQNEKLSARCEKDEVVVMTSAMFGRMELSRCVKKDYGYIGCGRDVMEIAHAYCSGRRECELPVPNDLLDQDAACPEDFKSYLRATHECKKVIKADAHRCSTSNVAELTAPEGLIASVVSQETACGTYKSPWKISVPPGQRINITLYDYSTVSTDGGAIGSLPEAACIAYASIREASIRPFTLCGGRESKSLVYTSKTNNVEIIIQGTQANNLRYFLLHYTAMGCADLTPPKNGWVKRDGDQATVGCNSGDEKWHLSCRQATWAGHVGNCSKEDDDLEAAFGFSISFGLAVAIVVLIALAIAGCILLAGLVCLHRRRKQPKLSKNLPRGTYEDNMRNEDAYQKGVYGYPLKVNDVYWSRTEGGGQTGENEYASIQENMSPGGNGNEDMRRPMSPLQYPDVSQACQAGTASTFKSGKYNNNAPPPPMSPDSAELREYFVLDPDSVNYQKNTMSRTGRGVRSDR